MKINAELIIQLRIEKSWSQEELAIAAGLNLRTIQRIEKEASASLQSKKALASALDIDIHDLDLDSQEMRMKPCPECRSDNVYQYQEDIEFAGLGGELLPKLSTGLFSVAKYRPVICLDCGYIRLFAAAEARNLLATSKYWQRV